MAKKQSNRYDDYPMANPLPHFGTKKMTYQRTRFQDLKPTQYSRYRGTWRGFH
jgi:hypothetical protein